jgi:hypothetical protein
MVRGVAAGEVAGEVAGEAAEEAAEAASAARPTRLNKTAAENNNAKAKNARKLDRERFRSDMAVP